MLIRNSSVGFTTRRECHRLTNGRPGSLQAWRWGGGAGLKRKGSEQVVIVKVDDEVIMRAGHAGECSCSVRGGLAGYLSEDQRRASCWGIIESSTCCTTFFDSGSKRVTASNWSLSASCGPRSSLSKSNSSALMPRAKAMARMTSRVGWEDPASYHFCSV